MKRVLCAIVWLLASVAATAQERGATVFNQNCAVCHQPKGEGAPGFAPKLAGTLGERAKTETGRRYLAQLVVSGMMGPITSGGEKFNDAMPGFTALADEEIVAVLAYVMGELNGASAELLVKPDDVLAARRQPMSPAAVRRLRER
ncbi:MAG: cytochrome c [Rhodoferax sp.]|nr:cytochrome c [Rhodoferax sp.]